MNRFVLLFLGIFTLHGDEVSAKVTGLSWEFGQGCWTTLEVWPGLLDFFGGLTRVVGLPWGFGLCCYSTLGFWPGLLMHLRGLANVSALRIFSCPAV